jgi:predicted aspartyl protease
MPTWIGSFNPLGSPTLKIKITGALGTQQEFEAIIDTGFSGFLSMPTVRAFPLGLILYGTTKVVLADGGVAFKYTALGSITVNTESAAGIIILEPNSTDFLIGMDFLMRFKKTLFVHENKKFVALIDDADVEEFMKKLVETLFGAVKKPAEAAQTSPAKADDARE